MKRENEKGFTLVEMLVVIAIIVVLASMVMPILTSARKEGLTVKCKSNMKQFASALEMAKSSNNERLPGSLTSLYPSYTDNKDIFLCPADMSFGKEGGKPPNANDQFEETDEADCSYFYEFSSEPCSWDYVGYLGVSSADDVTGIPDGGDASWNQVKYYQLYNGDTSVNESADEHNPYPPDRFPIVRCFWHTVNPDADKKTIILNLSFSGRIFESGPKWEDSAK